MPILSFLDIPVSEQRPLDDSTMGLLMSFYMQEMASDGPSYVSGKPLTEQLPGLPAELLKKTEEGLAFQIMSDRISRNNTAASPWLLLFLSILCESAGDAVLWAFTVHHAFIRGNKATYKLSQFCNDFPMGLPSEAHRSKVWKAQKAADAKFGNRLDTENWDYLVVEMEVPASAKPAQ